MRRSAFRLLLLLAAVALWAPPPPSHAAGPRIGFLSPGTPEGTAGVLAGLREGLREHGFVDGANVAIEVRYANERFDRLPELARELAALPVDVVVTYVTQASLAARQVTKTIPIVMVGVSDPLASGLVASLSRPGGNVTGTSAPFSESAGKGLEILKEAVPGLRRVAIVWNPANEVFVSQMLAETRAAAQRLGLDLAPVQANDSASIDRAFAEIAKLRVDAVNVLGDPVLAASWPRIAALTTKLRLPSVTVSAAYAEAGGLMTYGPSLSDSARVAGGHVAKILRGARAGDLPVERSVKFELVINARTAKAIGYAIPPSLRLRADRIIE